mgnify:FL=1
MNQGLQLAKNKRSRKWLNNQERKRKAQDKKKRKFESNPVFKKAKKHALFGFVGFILCLVLVVIFNFMNKEVPTGVSLSGVVVDWAADGPKRRHAKLNAKIKLENGFIFFIPFKDRIVGESLEFTEYKHKLTGNYKYRLKNQ